MTKFDAPRVSGSLFSDYFLQHGLRATRAWERLDRGAVGTIAQALRERWDRLAAMASTNEATTERELIEPALALLGWESLSQQAVTRDRRDVPDALLFRDTEAKTAAAKRKNVADRYELASVVVESEARDTVPDRASGKSGTPASQILRYLALAEPASGGAVRWGMLTNGRTWRLYYHGARSRAEGFIGFDMPSLLDEMANGEADSFDLFRCFLLLFHRDAHVPEGPDGLNFLEVALAEGRRYEQAITAALSKAVFDRVFPELIRMLARHDPKAAPEQPEWRQQVKNAALILLYRLLFLLYAEDRELLPMRHPGYAGYALRRLREEAAEARDSGRPLSATVTRWWRSLGELFHSVEAGDSSLGLPPYNGGFVRSVGGATVEFCVPAGCGSRRGTGGAFARTF